MTLGLLGEPSTLDPYASDASALTYTLARPLLPSLFRLLPDGTTEPYLAESLDETADGVLVTLREASWSDGHPITSEDVVASWRRAMAPSGLARLDGAEAVDDRTVLLSGTFPDWERVLATGAFVLPEGRFRRNISGGPLMVSRYRPGLRLDYEPNEAFFGRLAQLDGVTAFFYEDLSVLLEDLEEGELDAGAPPSTVNLVERLELAGLEHSSALGSEQIGLLGLSVGRDVLRGTALAIDLDASYETFIEDHGRRLPLLPGQAPARVTLASPRGDELLSLLARAAHFQARDEGVTVEPAEVEARFLYGEDPEALQGLDVALVRHIDVPGHRPARPYLALFEVETYLAWHPGVAGLQPNPTLEGPLWNAEEWSLTGEG
ncbi:MAG: ABC transporter substrate-binding protein [Actinomycetota bacterium]